MGINIKPRLSWLDNSKMMAMLLVIIYHVGSFANLGEVGPAIESFNMPLFMILSGYACYHSLFRDKTIREWGLYIKKNFMRIMIPCILSVHGRCLGLMTSCSFCMATGFYSACSLFYLLRHL